MNERDKRLRPSWREVENLGWRSLWSFVEASAGILGADAVFDWALAPWEIAAGAGVAAGITVVKNFASVRLGKQEV